MQQTVGAIRFYHRLPEAVSGERVPVLMTDLALAELLDDLLWRAEHPKQSFWDRLFRRRRDRSTSVIVATRDEMQLGIKLLEQYASRAATRRGHAGQG